jgi:hypothetical protein
MGIEPTSEAWEASILPLYDARSFLQRFDYTQADDSQYRWAILDTFQATLPRTVVAIALAAEGERADRALRLQFHLRSRQSES